MNLFDKNEKPKSELPDLPANLGMMFQDIYKNANRCLREHGFCQPVAIFIDYDKMKDEINEVHICGMQVPDHDGAKDDLAKALRQFGYRTKSTALVTVLEAWALKDNKDVSKMSKQNAAKYFAENRPSLSPERVEIVMLNLELKGVGTYTFVAEITRDANDKPSIPLTPPEPIGAVKTEGRFGDILNYKPAIPSAYEMGSDLDTQPDTECVKILKMGDNHSEESMPKKNFGNTGFGNN